MNISTLKRNALFVLLIAGGCCYHSQMEAENFEVTKNIVLEASALGKTFQISNDISAMNKDIKKIVAQIPNWLKKLEESSELSQAVIAKLNEIDKEVKTLLKSFEKKGPMTIRKRINAAKPGLQKLFDELIQLLKKEKNSEELVAFFKKEIDEAIKVFKVGESKKKGLFAGIKNAAKKAGAMAGVSGDPEVTLARVLALGVL